MEKMFKTLAIISAISLFLTTCAVATDVSYQIRSNVYDNTDDAILPGDFYWDANSFPAFLYMIKPGITSEIMYMHNSVNSSSKIELGDEIAEGDLCYISKPQAKKTKIGGFDSGSTYIVDDVDIKKYYLMGLFGAKYMVMPEEPSDFSAGCKPEKIAKILMETDDADKKKLFSGDTWDLKDGWSLVAQQVDVEGEKVWLELRKNGETVDTGVISTSIDLEKNERTYLYKDADDYPVFYCYVDSVFRGQDSDFVMLSYAFLRGDIKTISTGDEYGIFEVDGFTITESCLDGIDIAGSGSGTVLNVGDRAVVMSSSESITLDADKQIDLHDGIYIKTEDTSGTCLKMTLQKKCTITVPDCEECEKEESVSTTENSETAPAEASEEGIKASSDEQEDKLASTDDDTQSSIESEAEDANVVQSSMKIPGFGILFALMGTIGAFYLRR